MSEKDAIETSHQQLVETIEHARDVVKGAVADFLKEIQDAQRMCEKAEAIAREWNKQAETLALPERFRVDGHVLLFDIKRSVQHLDIFTSEGLLKRTPVSANDLAPQSILPSQKRVA